VSDAGVRQTRSLLHGRADARLGGLDTAGEAGDHVGVGGGNDHDAVVVGAHQVAGSDRDSVDDHWLLDGCEADAVFAGPHESAHTPQRIAEHRAGRGIPKGAVDDRSGDPGGVRDLGHDAAPDRAVRAASVVDHDHGTGWDVVEKVTNGAAAAVDRLVGGRVGRSARGLTLAQRPDPG
jgi:hypothetical protein